MCYKVKVLGPIGAVVTDEVEQVSLLREYYDELYAKRLPNCDVYDLVEDNIYSMSNVGFLTTFSNDNSATCPSVHRDRFTRFSEVASMIKGITPKTSAGDDQVPTIIIKKLPVSYILVLVAILNHCVNNAYFPRAWKTAIIIPLPKKKGTIEVKDFRPISLTSNLGKLLENLLLNCIHSEMREDAIPEFQFGFRNGHSTVDALSVLSERVHVERERRRLLAVCSLDIRKAFDSVWHEGLAYKLRSAGCQPHTVKSVYSFLCDRSAVIRLGSAVSRPFTVGRGVPQGSRMGPVLYNL